MIKWTTEKEDFIMELRDEDWGFGEIAQELADHFGEEEVPSPRAIEVKLSRLRRGIRNTRSPKAEPPQRSRLSIPEELDGEALLDFVQTAGTVHRKFDNTQFHADAHLEDQDLEWLMVVCSGDWHLENQHCMIDKLRKDLEVIRSTPGVYFMFIGDETDNFIPGGKHAGGSNEAVVPPQMARRVARALLGKIENKTLALMSGCHDQWSINADDYNFIGELAREMGVPYLGPGGTVDVHVNEELTYRFAIFHKYARYNSATNPLHVCRAYLQRGDNHCDVVAIGHHHVSAVSYENYQNRPVVLMRTGAYKPVDRFIATLGFRNTEESCFVPCVLINTKQRSMRVATSIQEGVELLKFLNKK